MGECVKKATIYVDGIKKEIVEETENDYFEDSVVSEDTIDLTDTIKNLENTIEIDKGLLDEQINGM